jgi:hypothetical protein
MTCFRLWECGAVSAGVKAEPCGWPTASLEPSSGRQSPGAGPGELVEEFCLGLG